MLELMLFAVLVIYVSGIAVFAILPGMWSESPNRRSGPEIPQFVISLLAVFLWPVSLGAAFYDLWKKRRCVKR